MRIQPNMTVSELTYFLHQCPIQAMLLIGSGELLLESLDLRPAMYGINIVKAAGVGR
jgi:hypothetical protein